MKLAQLRIAAAIALLVAANANADVGRGDRYSGQAWASRSEAENCTAR